jgi:hypothetical protein
MGTVAWVRWLQTIERRPGYLSDCLTSQHDPYLSRSFCVSEPGRCGGGTGVGGRKGHLGVDEIVDGFRSTVRKPGNQSVGSLLISIGTADS